MKWQPRKLVGDGAQCVCGRLVEPSWIVNDNDQAEALWGDIPEPERRDCYRRHQSGKFQFLSVCGLCREGYNDPDISCVAVFRPTTRKASSLAEQMKGRGCRPTRAIIRALNQCDNAEERLRMIRESAKPDCLIVDLVGITGLGDCASTIQIYAEGLHDEVRSKAEELLEEQGQQNGEGVNVEAVIEEAARQVEEENERLRELAEANERYMREQAEKRAKANVQVQYSTHNVGYGSPYDPNAATEKQMNLIARLGMSITGVRLTKKQAGRIINLLRMGKSPTTVAGECWLPADCWEAKGPSVKQHNMMQYKGVPTARAKSGYDASQLIDAKLNPQEYEQKKLAEIAKARNSDELTACGRDVGLVKPVLAPECWRRLVDAGRQRRAMLEPPKDERGSIP